MITLPSNWYFTAHLTLKCNFNCDYCIQKFEDPSKHIINHYSELTTDQWIEGLLHFSATFCVLSGGEVTLRNDVADIACAIADNFGHVEIGTNLSKDPQPLINKICNSGKRNVVIGTSFHPGQMNTKMFLLHIKKILDSSVSLNTIAIVDTFDGKGMEAYEQLLKLGIPKLSINPYQGKYDGKIYPKEMQQYSGGIKSHNGVICNTTILACAPNGNIYCCPHLAYICSSNSLGNIMDVDEKRIQDFIQNGIKCFEYGNCNPCSVYRVNAKEIKCWKIILNY